MTATTAGRWFCAFRDAEVIYSGLFATPEGGRRTRVDAIARHNTLFPRVVLALKGKGIDDVLVVGGGVIPEGDKKNLEEVGISGVFGPGTPLPTVIDHIVRGVGSIRKIQHS